MEKFPNILHSYSPLSDSIAFPILPVQRSFSVLIGSWFSRQSKPRFNRGEDLSVDDSLCFFDADYCYATDLSVDLSPDFSPEFQHGDSSYWDLEPVTPDRECLVFDFPCRWGPPKQQQDPLSGQILCLDECELLKDFLTGVMPTDFAIDRLKYFIIGSLIHLVALYMVLAIPPQSLRGLGGISDKPISVKLQTENEIVTPDDPSPASVDSPASLASLAQRDPVREEQKIQQELEKEQPAEPRSEEVAKEIERELSPMNEKHEAESIVAHQKPPQERSLEDNDPNNSKSQHDSMASTPSVARPEQKGSLKAGQEAEIYKDRILSAIHEAAYYPRAALKSTAHGQAVVCFTINKDGSLASVSIVAHADSEILDEAALKIVEKASSHFPPIPDALMKDQLTYVVPIVFKKRS